MATFDMLSIICILTLSWNNICPMSNPNMSLTMKGDKYLQQTEKSKDVLIKFRLCRTLSELFSTLCFLENQCFRCRLDSLVKLCLGYLHMSIIPYVTLSPFNTILSEGFLHLGLLSLRRNIPTVDIIFVWWSWWERASLSSVCQLAKWRDSLVVAFLLPLQGMSVDDDISVPKSRSC